MKRSSVWATAFLGFLLLARPAAAEHRFLVRSNLGVSALRGICLLHSCTVVQNLDGTLNQLFLVTTSDLIDPNAFLLTLRLLPGIVNAEVDQVLSLGSGLASVTTIPAELTETTPIPYYGSQVSYGYAYQPAAQIVRVADAQGYFGVTGTGIVADIDTGVDPTHPALVNVLLPGYDFTRNQPGGSELLDWPFASPPPCPNCQPAVVNQSSAAILDQSSAAILDGAPYTAFGHGTMVVGIIHLVAPTAQIMPLKAFHSDGTGNLSDILRAFYYAVENHANVINMSFDFTAPSEEMATAVGYANQSNVICVASAGNDGSQEIVYPASLSDVLAVAATSDLDTRSTFSNYGSFVWVAAPGEAIVTTYPFGTYSAGWGTSFSAPFVSGGSALLRSLSSSIGQSGVAQATAHAKSLTPPLGNGRLDLFEALSSVNP